MDPPQLHVGDPDSPPVLSFGSEGSDPDGMKVVNDPLHGHFELPKYILDIVDTPHCQRLRDLKQLGATYMVYPGASHNRFEHSLGVSHLSASFVRGLYSNTRDRFSAAPFDNQRHFDDSLRIVEVAGLAHDFGHGPFSHLFDHVFLPQVGRHPGFRDLPQLHHEERSSMLLHHLVDEYNLDYERPVIRQICSLITGDRPAPGQQSFIPSFLYDVVANQTTGVDTDKFDYLARDAYNVGVQGSGFDCHRLMKFAKVIDDHICFHRKEIFNVHHLFLTRFQLHRTVYNHRAAVGIDTMIADAFLEADSELKISDAITDPEEFLSLNDNLINTIQFSKSPRLAGAKDIVMRLRRRDLYKFVDEILLPAGMTRVVRPHEITTCQESGSTGVNLVPDDIVVVPTILNFGMKTQNPVDKVLFFKDWSDESAVHISSQKVSYVLPAQFEEKILRVYLRRKCGAESENYRLAAKKAFRNFIRRTNLGSPIPSPPPQSARKANGSSAAHTNGASGARFVLSVNDSSGTEHNQGSRP